MLFKCKQRICKKITHLKTTSTLTAEKDVNLPNPTLICVEFSVQIQFPVSEERKWRKYSCQQRGLDPAGWRLMDERLQELSLEDKGNCHFK